MTPCLSPLAAYRNDFHILSGVAQRVGEIAQGNGHTNSMSGLIHRRHVHRPWPLRPVHRPGDCGQDLVICASSRSRRPGIFRRKAQRNMSWAGYERALPPEMIPHRLFDRLFSANAKKAG